MKLFYAGKDGGPESNVTGFWLVELKRLFSIALLKFEHGSREAFHSHAFNCISWVFTGSLREEHLDGRVFSHRPGIFPIITRRSTFHRVFSHGTTWVLTFRGPWSKQWREYSRKTDEFSTLESGRIVVKREGAST